MSSCAEQAQMMAIVKLWGDGEMSGPRDNTLQYVVLMLCKLALDAGVLFLCRRRRRVSFVTLCGLSLVVADLLLVWSLGTVWFLGPAKSPVRLCFLLAHSSTTYSMMPLPMLGLMWLLDDLPDQGEAASGTRRPRNRLRVLGDCFLVVVLWVLAGLYCTSSDLLDLELSGGPDGASRVLVCPVQESALISYSCLGLTLLACCVLLPYGPKLTRWYREADRLASQRESCTGTGPFSDLPFVHDSFTQIRGEAVELEGQRPLLSVSVTMAFVSAWMPYLVVSSTCFLLGYGVPANIQVNLLWLEFSNSLGVALRFWLRSNSLGPYCQPHDEACMYSVYWHLSQGTGVCREKLPVAEVKSSGMVKSPLLEVM